ncbi:MAG: hypothetical protein ACKVOP_08215 [Sphingomonadaceae bacterium]
MTRLMVLILLVLVLVGGAVWLSQMNAAQEPKRVEKVIPADAFPR